ncbi:MAG TPA: sensor domain-containing diguanylate cyclase [Longimicrobium sp.]|nr:sensor domain-containing diguanylate cyclase [Longimicrobium sp.]
MNAVLTVLSPLDSRPALLQLAEALAVMLLPIAFAASIIGYRLFEVGAVVRRGLIFGVTAGVLAPAAYLAAASVDRAARGFSAMPLAVGGIAVLFLLGGVLFQPVARLVGGAVDRRFFPERLRLAELQRGIIPELAAYTALDRAGAHLTHRLQQALELERAVLLMADAQGQHLRPLAWAGELPPGARPAQRGVHAADLGGRPGAFSAAAPVPAGEPAVPARLGETLAALGAEVVVPIRLTDRLIGALLLGPPLHGGALERDALETLDAVATQASAMLENARLFALATRDPLTGLLRRHAAMERLDAEVERGRRTFHPFAVALADLDHFKAVNDTHGHAAGDAVLAEVAAAFAAHSRRTDLVARYGGEEFLFLLPDTPPDGARVHAEGIRAGVEALEVHVPGAAEPLPVTVSIGLCAVAAPEQLAEPEELVRRADEALYRAKHAGRNRVEPARVPPSA